MPSTPKGPEELRLAYLEAQRQLSHRRGAKSPASPSGPSATCLSSSVIAPHLVDPAAKTWWAREAANGKVQYLSSKEAERAAALAVAGEKIAAARAKRDELERVGKIRKSREAEIAEVARDAVEAARAAPLMSVEEWADIKQELVEKRKAVGALAAEMEAERAATLQGRLGETMEKRGISAFTLVSK